VSKITIIDSTFSVVISFSVVRMSD